MGILSRIDRIKKRTIKLAIIMSMITILSGSLSGCFLYPKEKEVMAPPLKEPPQIKYTTVDVARGPIEDSLSVSGTFVSVTRVNLFYERSLGRLKAYHVKVGDYVEKGDLLVELDTSALESQIKINELNLRKAEIDLLQRKASGADQYALMKIQIDIENQKEQLEGLKKQLEHANLTAPISGQVDFINTNYKVGDMIPAYTDLCRIIDQKDLQVEYRGDKAYEFKLGMETEIIVSNNVYKGVVVSTPSNMPEELATKIRETVYIKLYELPENVKQGETVRIKLIRQRKDNVLKLPRELVKMYSGRKYVPVLIDGKKVEKTVETGIETPTEVEIVNGLQEGDKVIYQ
ncbi:MAG TPA: efflux RND transporter periplasmic adaptor subunit [Clostridiaceae bacterium]|nr:efflux RND transporter periplasmic adaptor subunit [Clostridiaceae bacterium]